MESFGELMEAKRENKRLLTKKKIRLRERKIWIERENERLKKKKGRRSFGPWKLSSI
jgi:hypothetical protein